MPVQNKCGNLLKAPPIYIYIYRHIDTHTHTHTHTHIYIYIYIYIYMYVCTSKQMTGVKLHFSATWQYMKLFKCGVQSARAVEYID